MSGRVEAVAVRTSVDMLNAAMKMRSALDEEAQRWLRTEKVVYEKEFKYPRMTKREGWFWSFFYTGVAAGFMMAILLAPATIVLLTEPEGAIDAVLIVMLLLVPPVMVVTFVTYYIMTTRMIAAEKEWMKIILTDKFLVIVKTDMSGLQLNELYELKQEPSRFVSTIRIEKIISTGPQIANWVIRRYRNRADILMIKLVRRGEIFNTKLGDSIFFPIQFLASFLSVLRRLVPHIKIHQKLEAGRWG